VKVLLLRCINDLRGAPDMMGTAQAPHPFACHVCDHQGVTVHGANGTFYPGAPHRMLSVHHPLRDKWRQVFKSLAPVSTRLTADDPGRVSWAYSAEDRVTMTTDTRAREAANYVHLCPGEAPWEGFQRRPEIHRLPYFDVVHMSIYDAMHAMFNQGKMIREIFGGRLKSRAAKSQVALQQAEHHRRCSDSRDNDPVELPLFDQRQCNELDALCLSLRLTGGNGRLPSMFSQSGQWHGKQWVEFFGPCGVWLLCQMTMVSAVCDVLVRLCWWLFACRNPRIRIDQLPRLRQEGIDIFMQYEYVFPLECCTIAHHYLLHLVDTIERHGPIRNWWM